MTYEQEPQAHPDDTHMPLLRWTGRVRLRLAPDPQPSEAELALLQVEAELEAVRARGPVIAATVDRLNRAVERLATELRAG